MDWTQLPIVQGGAFALLLAVIWMVITGRLLPRPWVDQLREIDAKTIQRQQEEIAEWRKAWQAESLAKRELVSQVGSLMQPTEELLRTLSRDPS